MEKAQSEKQCYCRAPGVAGNFTHFRMSCAACSARVERTGSPGRSCVGSVNLALEKAAITITRSRLRLEILSTGSGRLVTMSAQKLWNCWSPACPVPPVPEE